MTIKPIIPGNRTNDFFARPLPETKTRIFRRGEWVRIIKSEINHFHVRMYSGVRTGFSKGIPLAASQFLVGKVLETRWLPHIEYLGYHVEVNLKGKTIVMKFNFDEVEPLF
jgi:hypothetical protein